MINSAERKLVLSHVKRSLDEAGFEDYPLIAGTATQGIEDTVQLLKDAKEVGIRWGMVLAPGYFATNVNQDGIMEWYTAVADQSPIPIMMYSSSVLRLKLCP